MSRKYIINEKASPAAVENAINALVAARGGGVQRLDGFGSGVKVVVRTGAAADRDGKVAVICGGGSGHEPAFAGMVARGFLTAAVCGDVFASPTARAVYEAIRAVTGRAGCLVVVMNYMGDRLQFGKGVERARAELGVPIRLVVVADDVALHPHPQPRGIAGTTLVLKACCAAADSGRPLPEVAAVATRFAENVKSLGISLGDCTVPAAGGGGGHEQRALRLASDEMEIGLGIHGEKGREIVPLEHSRDIATLVVNRLVHHVGFDDGAPRNVVALINNLGTATPLEMTQFTADVLAACAAADVAVAAYAAGHFVTSLDMHGVSVSLLPVGPDDLNLLQHPCEVCPAWQAPLTLPAPPPPPLPMVDEDAATGGVASAYRADPQTIERCLAAACTALIGAEPALTELDRQVGDADCGLTLKQGAEAVLAEMAAYPLHDPAATLAHLAATMEASMGGTSGALYVLAAQAAAARLRDTPDYVGAFIAAVDAISYYGGAGVGDCTMQDALVPAADALRAGRALGDVVAAARAGAASTARLAAALGRASYLTDEQVVGVQDPGAVACAEWLEALVGALGS